MRVTPLGLSLWLIGCVATGLLMHFYDHGDVEAVLKAALTITGIVLIVLLGAWLRMRLRP